MAQETQLNLRIDQQLYDDAKEVASATGINLSEQIRKMLREWIDKYHDDQRWAQGNKTT